MLRHLLPSTVPLLSALAAPLAGRAMLLEASLAFLGFAGSSATDSWGRLIADGRRFLPASWVMVIAPGLLLLGACALLSVGSRRLSRRTAGL
jgi:peptide/nickel transport system permease protein